MSPIILYTSLVLYSP